ncbi:hypothetical protein RJ639_027952 [Escallonia herrerae]|uniref:peptide-methionine (S)-S-oxide reductase n=1 Tax=Escallonia herrerae TaxID=1293975 RepID=A0AA88X9D2_9ASTE|nr:hypothetical protein RJ639_027952 [Escallonia herrerae]
MAWLMIDDNHLIGTIVLLEVVAVSGHFRQQPYYIEYDPRLITFRQLLELFWSIHDSTQVFGQGLDVGNQYRSSRRCYYIIIVSKVEGGRVGENNDGAGDRVSMAVQTRRKLLEQMAVAVQFADEV